MTQIKSKNYVFLIQDVYILKIHLIFNNKVAGINIKHSTTSRNYRLIILKKKIHLHNTINFANYSYVFGITSPKQLRLWSHYTFKAGNTRQWTQSRVKFNAGIMTSK